MKFYVRILYIYFCRFVYILSVIFIECIFYCYYISTSDTSIQINSFCQLRQKIRIYYNKTHEIRNVYTCPPHTHTHTHTHTHIYIYIYKCVCWGNNVYACSYHCVHECVCLYKRNFVSDLKLTLHLSTSNGPNLSIDRSVSLSCYPWHLLQRMVNKLIDHNEQISQTHIHTYIYIYIYKHTYKYIHTYIYPY